MKKHVLCRALIFLGICLSLSIAPVNPVHAASALYVAPGAPASGSCTRSAPCDFRYAAEIVASDGDVIYARSGHYTAPTSGAVHLLYIYKSLTIYGSCSFDASTPVSCDPSLQDSYLDGENDKRVITIQGLGTESVHIEGFTIYQGDGSCVGAGTCESLISPLTGCGGGIFVENIDELTLKNNYIWANKGGNVGGMGGGLYAEDVNLLRVIHNTFIFNQAATTDIGLGGAALVVDSGGPHAVEFENNIISGNEISSDDSTGYGAGLAFLRSNNVQITTNEFNYQNRIHQRSIQGSSVYLGDITGFSMEQNHFREDTGISVVYVDGSNGAVENSWVYQNTFWDNLVALNLEIWGTVSVDIFNNFLGRQVITRGGSSANIYVGGTTAAPTGNVDIYFNTIAAANFGIQIDDYSHVNILNNILTGLTTEAINLISLTGTTYTIDTNLYWANGSNGCDPGTNPIYDDPMLVDMINGDFHLQPGSGAIDRTTAVDFVRDIDGDPRPVGLGNTPYDLGADEYALSFALPLVLK